MNPLEQLKSVICDPDGKCCITGSDEDRAIVDRALQALAPTSTQCEVQPEQEPDDMTIAYMSGFYDGKKKRPWVGLTDEEASWCQASWCQAPSTIQTWKRIEAKLKEKNT